MKHTGGHWNFDSSLLYAIKQIRNNFKLKPYPIFVLSRLVMSWWKEVLRYELFFSLIKLATNKCRSFACSMQDNHTLNNSYKLFWITTCRRGAVVTRRTCTASKSSTLQHMRRSLVQFWASAHTFFFLFWKLILFVWICSYELVRFIILKIWPTTPQTLVPSFLGPSPQRRHSHSSHFRHRARAHPRSHQILSHEGGQISMRDCEMLPQISDLTQVKRKCGWSCHLMGNQIARRQQQLIFLIRENLENHIIWFAMWNTSHWANSEHVYIFVRDIIRYWVLTIVLAMNLNQVKWDMQGKVYGSMKLCSGARYANSSGSHVVNRNTTMLWLEQNPLRQKAHRQWLNLLVEAIKS